MGSYSNISTLLVLSLFLFLSPPFIHKPHNLVAAQGTTNAIQLVNSLSNQGNKLVTEIGTLVSQTTDANLKGVYNDCLNKYKTNIGLSSSAKTALENHNYKGAGDFVGKAFMLSSGCHHFIEQHLSQVPVTVTNEIILYEKVSVDALNIIQGLH